ncbi:MAG: serine hydrolase domain-containing protein [Labilibaculum antarcticum]
MKHLLIAFLILCSFFSSENKIYSQNIDVQTSDLNAWIDSTFTEALNSVHIAGATLILMQGDSILHINGYGLEDIKSKTPVNSSSSIFGIGSISKTFVGTAVMKLVEVGELELDRDVNNYLKSFQLAYKFNDSITVRNILTHTAGFDDCNIGTIAHAEEDIIPLAQYIKEQMSPQIRPSGKVISYSNKAYALLGLIVEEVSGLPFHEYVRKMILQPLEMNYSGYRRQAELKENYVTSYLQKNGQLIPYKPAFHHFYPASSFRSTASDMGHYISMFLNNGEFNGIQILDSSTVVKMHQTGFKNYEKANFGWLLGFQESHWYGIRTVHHSGGIQGFASQLTLMPEKNLGLFICVNSSNYYQRKSRVFMDKFSNDLFARLMPECLVIKEKAIVSPKVGAVDEPLEMFTGTYRFTTYAHTTFDKVGVLIGLAPEIEIVSKDNTLEIVEWNDKLVPISDLTFLAKYDRYLAFGRNTKGEISYFFTDSYSYQKLKWYEPIKFQRLWIGSIVLFLLIYIITGVVRKLFVRNRNSHLLKKINFSLASLVVLFIAVLAYALFTTNAFEFFYGIPLLIKMALVLPFLIIPLEFVSGYLLIKAFRYKELKTLGLIYQSVILVAALLFIPWLMYYNLIGFNY